MEIKNKIKRIKKNLKKKRKSGIEFRLAKKKKKKQENSNEY